MKKISEVVSRVAGLCLAPAVFAVMFATVIAPSPVQAAPKNLFLLTVDLDIAGVAFTPEAIAVTPDSKVVYVAARGPANQSAYFAVNATFGTIIARVVLPGQFFASGIAISPDGTLVYLTSEGFTPISGTIALISTANNLPIGTITFPFTGPFPRDVTVSPDGKTLWVANEGAPPSFNNGSVFVYNAVFPFALLAPQVPIGASVSQVRFSASGKTVYAMDTVVPGFITRINPATLVPGAPRGLGTIVPTFPFPLAINPQDGTDLYIANVATTISQLDSKTFAQEKAIVMFPNTVPVGFQGLGQPAINPGGTLLYVAEPGFGAVGWVTLATGVAHKLNPVFVGGAPEFLAFSPNGNFLYVGDVGFQRLDFIQIK
jgi:DNA-binding beta-propeller fold protein YncE